MKTSNTLRRQHGLTMISGMFIIAIGVFFALLGIKMVPAYLEYFSIKKILTRMEQDRSMRRKSAAELREIFKRSLRINSVYEFNLKDFKVKRVKDEHEVRVKYEVRKPVAGNISVVMDFDEKITIPAR